MSLKEIRLDRNCFDIESEGGDFYWETLSLHTCCRHSPPTIAIIDVIVVILLSSSLLSSTVIIEIAYHQWFYHCNVAVPGQDENFRWQ